ncbi:MAG TPA: monodechloroaminopyrrolnitrin synthase PrnB family protein [Actinophytocola sp.]|uniref:monodechloroaminopyrrolnitrin synthase PrnB family protein n=1 Tax=Actinophytocola sp. TaxID=1872138 RepID=UPI002E02F59C|nr:monodechloroaminopyrrolnitrin synthase PrnB family protein [Actinophytocola sp.]
MELPEFVPERVAALDPLGADDACARLPRMNAGADVGALASTLSALLPSATVLSGLSYDECLAAMRDLGMFLASLKRHGTEPVSAVPAVEPVLVELGRRTDMVPRETIHHYTELNPTGARQRMYRTDPMEADAINIMRLAFRHFTTAIGLATQLAPGQPQDPEFPVLATALADELGSLDTAMTLSHEHLEPGWFYGEFLPYTYDIGIAGTRYMGPSAAQFPLAVIDMLLWESDHASPDLATFRSTRVAFTRPHLRALHAQWAALPSLTTRVHTALTDSPTSTVHDSATALTAVLRALLVFRGKHLAYARKGSSAAHLALLQDITDQTRHMTGLARVPTPS